MSILLAYLRFFAKQALKKNHPVIIGITGSYGKSSARDLLYTVLKDHFKTKVATQNSQIGLPLSILGLKPQSLGFTTLTKSIFDWMRIIVLTPISINYLKDTEYLIAEMGINDPYPPNNMEYLLSILKPDLALFLNAASVHTQQFEVLLGQKQHDLKDNEKTAFLIQKIAEEKVKIITQSGCIAGIYNADNKYVKEVIQQHKIIKNCNLISFGKEKVNSISYGDYNVNKTGTDFSFNLKSEGLIKINVKDYLLPEEYREIIAAVILCALQIGLNIEQIKSSLERYFTLPRGRTTILKGINGSMIIDSSYNASRRPTEAMLDLLKALKAQRLTTNDQRPILFLFGDMRELGDEAKAEHEAIAEKLTGIVDYLFLVGPLTRQFVLPTYHLPPTTYHLTEVRWFDTAIRAGEYLKDNLPKNAIILVKGSQNTIFLEEAIKYILADKKDEAKLCRQEEYWMKIKNNYFSSHSQL